MLGVQDSRSMSLKSPTSLITDNTLKNINAIDIKNVAEPFENYPTLTEYDDQEIERAKR